MGEEMEGQWAKRLMVGMVVIVVSANVRQTRKERCGGWMTSEEEAKYLPPSHANRGGGKGERTTTMVVATSARRVPTTA
jgi:L-aminopeptidase/D-esterase-like protein